LCRSRAENVVFTQGKGAKPHAHPSQIYQKGKRFFFEKKNQKTFTLKGEMMVEITATDGTTIELHPRWLRERANDPTSIDTMTQQRLYNPSDLQKTAEILSMTHNDGWLTVTFNDGATTHLRESDLLAELPDAPDTGLPRQIPWHTNDAPHTPIKWATLQTKPGLFHALRTYHQYGYLILSNVPCVEGTVMSVARTFGFARETNFGLMWDVVSKPPAEANDLSYTDAALDPHTDNPYREPVPGIQLLHCMVNRSNGGHSTLVDGLAVANEIRATAPDSFEALRTTKIRFRFIDKDTELVTHRPIIEADENGVFTAIHFSPRLDVGPRRPPAQLDRFFAARALINDLLKSPRFERQFLLQEGELMMFDNRRLLHGRTGYDAASGPRHLQGCYIDADAPRSRYRVLARTL
jgi:gamma-butyrobetaine dioxygenase